MFHLLAPITRKQTERTIIVCKTHFWQSVCQDRRVFWLRWQQAFTRLPLLCACQVEGFTTQDKLFRVLDRSGNVKILTSITLVWKNKQNICVANDNLTEIIYKWGNRVTRGTTSNHHVTLIATEMFRYHRTVPSLNAQIDTHARARTRTVPHSCWKCCLDLLALSDWSAVRQRAMEAPL